MTPLKAVIALISLGLLSSCGPSYMGKMPVFSFASQTPHITQVVVHKNERRLYLLSKGFVVKKYDIGLGTSPRGDKKIQGDGKTPEGVYYIDRKNPYSKYHLSLGISYPNYSDKFEARRLGKSPGGDIFIHGEDRKKNYAERDWTAGCISVKNKDIEEIFALVKVGTPIIIRP